MSLTYADLSQLELTWGCTKSELEVNQVDSTQLKIDILDRLNFQLKSTLESSCSNTTTNALRKVNMRSFPFWKYHIESQFSLGRHGLITTKMMAP